MVRRRPLRWVPSLYRVGIVLTLVTGKSEGHLAYRSQSDNPLQGTTLGGSADDPRREGTRTAPACHPARSGAGQCQSGVPGSGDLPRAVLPLAPPAGALRDRRRASTSISGPPRPARRTGPGDGAIGAERRGECGDVGAGRIAAYVGRHWGLRVAPSTVQRALRRAGLA